MIVCFECRPETKRLIEELVSNGLYKDTSDVISSALENLSILQNHISDNGLLVIPEGEPAKQRRSVDQPQTMWIV